MVRQRQLYRLRGTPACAGQPGLLIRWSGEPHKASATTIQTVQHFISPLSQLQVHNKLPQARQLLGHNLERRSLWQTPVIVMNWLFSPRPLLPWSVFSSERMPNLSLHTLKLNSDSGKMVLDSCTRKFVNASGLAWIFDNCVQVLQSCGPKGNLLLPESLRMSCCRYWFNVNPASNQPNVECRQNSFWPSGLVPMAVNR